MKDAGSHEKPRAAPNALAMLRYSARSALTHVRPEGLFHVPNFVTPEEEVAIVTQLDRIGWGEQRARPVGPGRGRQVAVPVALFNDRCCMGVWLFVCLFWGLQARRGGTAGATPPTLVWTWT